MQQRATVPRVPVVRNVAIQPPAPQPAHPSVARIYVIEKGSQSLGSGTLIDVRDQYGLVVTNWHVIRDATGEISVVFPDGFRSAARVVQHDADWDLAALSVWRPPTAPVRISPEPPKPGEVLTIAGYGSDGSFRAVSGACTQYLAPSSKHPHEIVELAAPARQGDSGGPILNARGELAGVLFGSVDNTTSGSYGGRVLAFLEPLLKSDAAVTTPPGAAPPANAVPTLPTNPVVARSLDNQLKPREYPSGISFPPTKVEDTAAGKVPSAQPAAPLAPVIDDQSPEEEEFQIVHTPLLPRTSADSPEAAQQPIFGNLTLQDFVGRTPIEQGKSALSVVGVLALAMFVLRLGGRTQKED